MLQSLTDAILAKQEHYDRLKPHFISTPNTHLRGTYPPYYPNGTFQAIKHLPRA
jgi:hypothetical protein